jgi:hypothetical protein
MANAAADGGATRMYSLMQWQQIRCGWLDMQAVFVVTHAV